MAHKKGVGSSKNGRESESKRLGVKILVVSLPKQVISLLDKEEQFTTLEKMSISAKTILFMLELTV